MLSNMDGPQKQLGAKNASNIVPSQRSEKDLAFRCQQRLASKMVEALVLGRHTDYSD
jgi:hypothetical protein